MNVERWHQKNENEKKEKEYCWFSHDVTKSQTTKQSILLRFYFHGVLEQLKIKLIFEKNFRFKRVLGFVIAVRLNFLDFA